jgi:hypothetical protein
MFSWAGLFAPDHAVLRFEKPIKSHLFFIAESLEVQAQTFQREKIHNQQL